MIRSLLTRGKFLDEAYPSTNQLFNQIEFVDVPSIIYQGDLVNYTQFTDTKVEDDQLKPDGPNTSALGQTVFLWGEDDEENAVSFDASLLTRGNIDGYGTFKAGATHSFGIVYYDQFNRNGGVQTVPDMYVNWYDNRFVENSLYGRVDGVFRVKHTAPSWAVRWAPVYASINSIINKFQYSIIRAFVATNLQAKPFAGISSFEDWWVHPDLVDEKIINIMKDTNQNTKNAEDYIFCNKF